MCRCSDNGHGRKLGLPPSRSVLDDIVAGSPDGYPDAQGPAFIGGISEKGSAWHTGTHFALSDHCRTAQRDKRPESISQRKAGMSGDGTTRKGSIGAHVVGKLGCFCRFRQRWSNGEDDPEQPNCAMPVG